jgi:hypothetical protein
MAGAWIEAYVYSEGPASDTATAALQTAQTLAVYVGGTAATHYARPSATTLWSALLTAWASQLSAAAGFAVGVTYSATTRRTTITGAAAIRPTMVGNGAAFTGFTQTLTGTATSWTAASAPQGRAELLGVTVEVADDWTHTELERYRHGRARATVWGNHAIHRVTMYASGEGIASIQAGYLQAGRVRVYQDAANLSAYDYANIGGYVDGWIVGCQPGVEESENLWRWDLLVGVPR